MTRSRQRSIGSWLRAVWEMPYPGWIVRCFASLGVDLEERRNARERHPIAYNCATALVIGAVAAVIWMVLR